MEDATDNVSDHGGRRLGGIGAATHHKPRKSEIGARAVFYQLIPLLVLFSVYWIVALRSNLNIGHRHILPTYPPMFVFAGAAGLWFPVAGGRRVAKKAVVVAARDQSSPSTPRLPRFAAVARGLTLGALVIGAVETIGFWPNYLAYFNVVAGGPRHAYRRLVDSSLDWGRLERVELARCPSGGQSRRRRVYLSYFGTARPLMYEIHAQACRCSSPDGKIATHAADRRLVLHQRQYARIGYPRPFSGPEREIRRLLPRHAESLVPFQGAAADAAAFEQMLESAPRGE